MIILTKIIVHVLGGKERIGVFPILGGSLQEKGNGFSTGGNLHDLGEKEHLKGTC